MKRGESKNVLRMAVVGDFQIGKSSLVNCLAITAAAETGEGYFPTTDTVAEYPFISGVRLVDTPGFDDARPELAKLTEEAIQNVNVILFIKTEETLGEHDERVLCLTNGIPLIVLFNCTDKTLGRRGWLPDLTENTETCEDIIFRLARKGFSQHVLPINGALATPVNILWAQFGLGHPLSEEQKTDIEVFAMQKLGIKLQNDALRAEMLHRSGFLPVRDFLKNLPLELLKLAVSNPQREIDRIVDRFATEFKKRWTAA